MKNWLTRSSTLWILFAAFVLISLAFGVVMMTWEFVMIDEMSNPEAIRTHLASMTQEQKNVHLWTTATLDVLYPFAYGLLFAGMALRFFGPLGPLLAAPSFLVIPFDLAEGAVQVLTLSGDDRLLWLKVYVTPIKLGLFLFGLFATLIAGVIAFRRRTR